MTIFDESLENSIRSIGSQILQEAKSSEPSFWELPWWERQAIKWMSGDSEMKTGVLRFIDVFPSLKSGRAVARHLREYLPSADDRLPDELKLHRRALRSALITPGTAGIAAGMVIDKIARGFIVGENMESAASVLSTLCGEGFTYTLDLLGEATLSEKDAELFTQRYVDLINYMAARSASVEPAVNISVKLSALSSRFSPLYYDRAVLDVTTRLRRIMVAAKQTDANLTVDMENYEVRDLTLSIFLDLISEPEFDGYDGAGIVVQAYLTDAESSLENLLARIDSTGRRVTIRLVKGAYWEKEVVTASQKRWAPPVLMSKVATDMAFERMIAKLLQHDGIVTAIASHNVRSISTAIALSRKLGADPEKFEIQALHGMGDEIKRALINMGVPVRVYAPLGELAPGMAYLVRRVLENSSNESFLRRSFVEDRSEEELMAKPAKLINGKNEEAPEPSVCLFEDGKKQIFFNEPAPKFHEPDERRLMESAIRMVGETLGGEYSPVIDGVKVDTETSFESCDPSTPSRVVGRVGEATEEMAGFAVSESAMAFTSWRKVPVTERVEPLMKAAGVIRDRKHELAALQMFEVGKTGAEALADVDEAIDLVNYYAVSALEILGKSRTDDILGESNIAGFIPRGPGIIISPWNFPLAILAGQTASALAAGNTVVIKPSSLSAVTASVFVDILSTAGIPDGVVNFVPGPGSLIGPVLVESPQTTFVSFTGSFDVGASLVKKSGTLFKGRGRFMKVVAEMGGKNAIIVDESADLDEAVAGVVASAFGFGGQKCSACSRVIVHETVYDRFIERLKDAVESLIVGSQFDSSTNFGPLVEETAVRRIKRYVEMGDKEATRVTGYAKIPVDGYFVPPTVFSDAPPDSPLAQDEIFGPVLSVIRATNINEAIDIANNVRFGLTGGVYSRTPSTIKKIVERLAAGNLYVNRGITGAVVRRQPFGGFKASGLGNAKAGSADFLRELSIPQTVSENTLRHGFTPDLES